MSQTERKLGWADFKTKGNELTISVSGRLDTMLAMSLDEKMSGIPDEVSNIIFDFDGLDYLSRKKTKKCSSDKGLLPAGLKTLQEQIPL